MSTTPTNNPIPSESPRDLAFNAGKVDEFVNSPEEAFSDRFGVARLTITGIQAEADGVISSISDAGEQAILAIGFTPVDSFEAGATITLRNQSLHYLADNNYYRWDGALPKVVAASSTPASSGGEAVGAWRNVTDNTLRSQLASSIAGLGDDLVVSKRNASTAISRTLGSIIDESIGTADFSSFSNAADFSKTQKRKVFVPSGGASSINDAPTGRFYGDGKISTPSGLRGNFYSLVDSAPSSIGNESSVLTAFNGDTSGCQFSIEHRITGANTLGQPATGYTYQPESMPNYTYLYNASGWNQSLAGNGGRTGVAAYRAKVDQYGQGDAVCFNGSAFVTGTKSGSTNFLANPAAVLFNGDMTAGANGVYLNPHEVILQDNGFDVAAIGFVGNFLRTVNTGAKTAIWHGARYQSVGSASCDAIISASGAWNSGIDFAQSTTDFGTNKAAISLKGGQRIYLNNAANASGSTEAGWHTTVFNGDYISYDTDHINIVAGGVPAIQTSAGQVTIIPRIKTFNSFDIVSSGNVTSTAGAVAQYLVVYVDGVARKIALLNP